MTIKMQLLSPPEYHDHEPGGLKVRHRYCGFWLCPECHPKMARQRRDRIREGFKDCTDVMMLSLTIDRRLFETPDEAYEWVVSKKKLSRLVGELSARGQLTDRRYFAVMEPQKDGWPHFHLLLNARFIDQAVVRQILRRWVPPCQRSEAWENGDEVLGHSWLNRKPIHAAAEYLSKAPDHPAPAWILKRGGDSRRIRFTFASQGFKKSVAGDNTAPDESNQGPPRRPRASRGPAAGRTYGERLDLCRHEVSLFEPVPVKINDNLEFTRDRFVATLRLTEKQAVILAQLTQRTAKGFRIDFDKVDNLIQELEIRSGQNIQIHKTSAQHLN